MDNDLPDDFELVVVGTGMIESIVAAAASRIGKRVLHVDSNDFYGGIWASFTLENIDKYIINQEARQAINVENYKSLLSDNEKLIEFENNTLHFKDVEQKWHIPKLEEIQQTVEENQIEDPSSEDIKEQEIPEENTEVNVSETDMKDSKKKIDVEPKGWYQEKILKNNRKFNLDLAPKIQFARGNFVELLISSNIARYSEYRSVSRILTIINDQLEIVPCSRSDVFSSTKVNIVEKRILMKLLNFAMEGKLDELQEYENKKFIEYLQDKKLTPNLIHYVLYAISMSNSDTLCLQGFQNTKRFLNSLGRFGKTPFLYSMYGSGELPQAFCRLCAVFGGTYCLNRAVNAFIIEDNKCKGIVCGDQRINAAHVIVSSQNISETLSTKINCRSISRAILLTDKSILESEKENLSLLLYPTENGKNLITIIEMGTATGTCPSDIFLIHMFCKKLNGPKSDFEECVSKLFGSEEKPNILWSLYLSVEDCEFNNLPENMFSCPGPDLDLDYDDAVDKAKSIFKTIYPDCEFLPRAPDPEEIILCEDEEEVNAEPKETTE